VFFDLVLVHLQNSGGSIGTVVTQEASSFVAGLVYDLFLLLLVVAVEDDLEQLLATPATNGRDDDVDGGFAVDAFDLRSRGRCVRIALAELISIVKNSSNSLNNNNNYPIFHSLQFTGDVGEFVADVLVQLMFVLVFEYEGATRRLLFEI